MDQNPIVASLIGGPAGWSRPKRLWLGSTLFLGYLIATAVAPSRYALWLALALYLALRRWVITEPEPGRFPDAFLGALAVLPVSILAFLVYTFGSVTSSITFAAGRIWLPLGLVGIALCLDRYLRRAGTLARTTGTPAGAPGEPGSPPDAGPGR